MAAPNQGQFPPGFFQQQVNPAMNAFRLGMNGAGDDASDFDNEEEPTSHLSMINITIRSPLVVTGNNNLIASDSAATANSIAMGVVAALRQLSMGAHGIPMIDEQGRPRPIGVEVLAEVRIEGSQNVVGERAVLARMLDLKEKGREFERRKYAATAQAQAQAQAQASGNANGMLIKIEPNDQENRKRDHDEFGAEADLKRTRRD